MSKKEEILIEINKRIDELSEARHFKSKIDNGFPVCTQPKINSGDKKEGVHIQFGLSGQNKMDYVERLLNDGSGWNQIALAIGWIGFGVFKSYYSEKYSELFKSMGIFLIDPNHDLVEGWLNLDLETKELNVIKPEEAISTNHTALSNVIRYVQFINRQKEIHLFEQSDKKIDVDFFMDIDAIGNTVCYHAWVDYNDKKTLLKSDDLKDLMSTIIEKQETGLKTLSPVYFDIIEGVDDNDKKIISNESLGFYQSIGFK